ncbi:hypothetical protein L1267_22060 [Pseudoalteromonas sp. OFAV1]|uniref:hypothetical protein n=1 Tax=Pseudoalteromonas sp. OFAV1 TaxID=2908892 RepID=UPI001F3A22D1|nr:hypothetical protein [Pseudoalteromonas sp. OFAV1]MCF2903057.1 hypothetical protein [Pseudoalteromonas sp. OFAV1]
MKFSQTQLASFLPDSNLDDFVRALSPAQQEAILTSMMNLGTISVHVNSLHETFTVDDVYDNTGESKHNHSSREDLMPDTSKLSIIYLDSDD